MADLNDALSRLVVRGPHPLGMLNRERHRFFLVHVLAGIQGGDKVLAMQMLRRRDQHGIDRFVVEKPAIVVIRRGVWNEFFRILQASRVDVRKSDEFDSRLREGFSHELGAAVTWTDDA